MASRLTTLLKVLGFVLGGVAALVLATALYVWVSFDARRVQTELTRYLAENYQRTLHLEGGLSLSLWPRPELRLGDASLSEPKRDTAFITIKRARLKLALRPLLMQQLVVSGIVVRGGVLNLARDPSGTWNFADLIKPDENNFSPLDSFQLEGVDLADVALSLHDTDNEAPAAALQALQLTTGSLHAGGIDLVHAQAKLTMADPSLDGDIRLDTRYQILSGGAGRLDDFALRFHGRAATLTDTESALRLNALTWTGLGATWQLDKAQLKLNGSLGKRALEASAELPALAWAKDAPRGDLLKAQLTVHGADRTMNMQTELRGISAATGGFAANRMQTKWQLRNANGTSGAYAELSSPLRVDWHNRQADWERLTGELQLKHPALNAANARAVVDGAVIWRFAHDKKYAASSVKLAARFGTDDLRLAAQVSNLSPLAAHFDLSAANFDVDRMLVPAVNVAPVSQAIGLLASWFDDAALDGQITLGAFKLHGIRTADVKAPVSLDQGKFESSPHSLSMYGGTLKGSVSFDINDKSMKWQEAFQNVDVQAMRQDIATNLLFTGRASGSLDLTAQGADAAALTRSATGIVRLKLAQPGGLHGIDISQSLREFRNAFQAGQASSRTPNAREQTELAEISGNIGINEGKLFTRSLVAHNGWLRMAFDGEYDMQQETFDLGTHVVVSNLLPKSPASDLGELRGKPVSLRIKGPLAKLALELETSPVVAKPLPAKTALVKPPITKPTVPAQTPAKSVKAETKTAIKAVAR